MKSFLLFLFLIGSIFPQSWKIRGRLTLADGSAVVNATIRGIKNADWTFSRENGFFVLTLNQPVRGIIISHIACVDTTISVPESNAKIINLGTIVLKSRQYMLPHTVVTANRSQRSSGTVLRSINIIDLIEISHRSSGNTAELLREEEGLSVQKTNHGGGSLKIRGLSSSQILLAVDGIRLNNSIYRLGNHQYLTTVDEGLIDQLEVVRGPASVLYGSDAMGGMVNIISRTPRYGFHMSSHNAYQTADHSFKHINRISFRRSRFYFSGGFSYKQYGDLRRGAWNPYKHPLWNGNGVTQSPSGYLQRDWDIKLNRDFSRGRSILIAFQHTGQSNVPRYDKLERSHYHRWSYSPQIRNLAYVKFKDTQSLPFLDRVSATFSRQEQREGRNYQKKPSDFFTHDRDQVITYGLSFLGEKRVSRHRLTAGSDVYSDEVSSQRLMESPGHIETAPRGKYPNNARYNRLDFFVLDEWLVTRSTLVNAGLRYNYSQTEFDLQLIELPQLPNINSHFSDITWQLGVRRLISSGWSIISGLYKGFRAPNLADMARFGESKGSTFEIPNTHLVPEKIIQAEIGLHFARHRTFWSLTFYKSWLSDLIDSADDRYLNSDSILVGSTYYKVKSKQNIGDGIIWGTETAFRHRFKDDWMIAGNFSYVYGENKSFHEPMSGIPPALGLIKLAYSPSSWSVVVFSRFASSQRRLSTDDMDDERIPTNGTAAWWTLNTRLFCKFTTHIQLFFSIENILDMNYREHGSGMNNPGRNFIMGIRLHH